MSTGLPHPAGLDDGLGYPFFQSVFDRKSRRMGLGMEMPGTLEYASPYEPVPLTELEEALLLVAGTGLTGLNLGDIDPSMGADAMVQWTARTWPSSCSNHGTELFFTNDDGLYFLDMWNLMPEDGEISTLQNKTRDQQVNFILELVRGAKKQLEPARAQMPTGLPGLFVFNHWNANKPGTTLFLPVSNMTLEYINLLFIYFSPEYRFTLVDETAGYAPCGLQHWIDSGRLDAEPPDGDRRDRAAGAVDAGRRAGLHLPEHQPRPAGDGPRRLDLHRLHRPLRPRRDGRAGARLPLRRRQARPERAGRPRRGLRGLHPALPRRHGRGGRRLPRAQVVPVRSPTSPRPTSSPTRSPRRSSGPPRRRSRSSRTTASTSTTPTGASRPTWTRCTSA